jgi:hypothetical protein
MHTRTFPVPAFCAPHLEWESPNSPRAWPRTLAGRARRTHPLLFMAVNPALADRRRSALVELHAAPMFQSGSGNMAI